MLSTIQRLAISEYNHTGLPKAEGCPVFQTLSSADQLRTLTLTGCDNEPFVRALDPEQNPFNLVLCLNMEALVLYPRSPSLFNIERLIGMARNRASRGAKLSSVTLIDLGGVGPDKELLKSE